MSVEERVLENIIEEFELKKGTESDFYQMATSKRAIQLTIQEMNKRIDELENQLNVYRASSCLIKKCDNHCFERVIESTQDILKSLKDTK